jgi:cytochrome P450
MEQPDPQFPDQHEPEWDPRHEDVLADQLAAYDQLRRRCPVAHSDYLGWSVLRHADVLTVAQDHDAFSNAVSAHLSVPNGMDPPEHTAFREVLDPYFTDEEMSTFEPACREVTRGLLHDLPRGTRIDLMEDFARPLALRLQSRWLGWPESLHEPLRDWTLKNHRATLARDREAMAAVALEFDSFIVDLLEHRRTLGEKARGNEEPGNEAPGNEAPDDLTTRLMREQVDSRPLTDPEIVSILRNWTVGELSTIAASVGIIVAFLARDPGVAERLRREPDLIPPAVDEILRIHPPLIANRRVTRCPVEVGAVEAGGRRIAAGERVTLLWASANRDEAVFGDPDEFRLDRDPEDNLLYGTGIHVCPGAPLARMELRVTVEELLSATTELTVVGEPSRATYPASGYSDLPLVLA